MAEWARVIATSISKYTKGFEDATKRRRILLDRCEKAGNIEYDVAGENLTWQAKKAQHSLQVNNGTQILNFNPLNPYSRAQLDYQGYAMADLMTKREKLMNRGPQAMIDYWSKMTKDMLDDLHDRFAEELYIDINAAGNTGHITGFNSMIGTVTQTYDATNATATVAHSANPADPVGVPVATYAGLSTVPGAAGGNWYGRWPDTGHGDALFDYWSPLIVNYTSTYFDGSSTTWGLNCVLALRFAILFSGRNIASEGQADLALMHTNMFRQYKDKLDPKERTLVNQGSKDREYGIARESFLQDGCEVTHEFGVPSNEVYGYNMSKFEIKSMQGKLFESEGPYWNPSDRSWRVAVDFLGQLKFPTPRNQFKCQAIA